MYVIVVLGPKPVGMNIPVDPLRTDGVGRVRIFIRTRLAWTSIMRGHTGLALKVAPDNQLERADVPNAPWG